MHMTKRLFLFAGYDAKNRIDKSLIYTLKKLSELGNIILSMDCDAPDSELAQVAPYTIYATATKHGEYDFGSYKRAYTYAADNNIISKYDFVYFINDSVYGPLYDLGPILEKMESENWDAFGLAQKPHASHPHIQSWFIGCRKNVFTSTWFDDFFRRITRQKSKGTITRIYEQGFTRELISRHIPYGALYSCPGRSVYNNIKKLYKSHMPFMKKAAMTRRHGGLGRQILYVLNHISPDARDAIMENSRHTWGDEYMCWLLTKNPVKIIYRSMHHCARKVFIEGI